MGRKKTAAPGKYGELGLRVQEAFRLGGYESYTLEELGKEIGLSKSGMEKLWNGKNAAKFETLLKIVLLTNTNFEWLYTGRGMPIYNLTGGKLVDISSVPQDKLPRVMKTINDVIELSKGDYSVDK